MDNPIFISLAIFVKQRFFKIVSWANNKKIFQLGVNGIEGQVHLKTI